MKKIAISFAIIIAVAAISIFICKDKAFKKEETNQEAVQSLERVAKIYKVQNKSEQTGVNYPGTVKSLKHADLFFRVSGPIIERDLKEGQTVKKGSVLMKIDPRDYKRQVDTLTQQLTAAKEQSKLNETEHNRAKKLYEENAISKSAYDAALTKKNVSEAQTKSLEESLKVAKDKLADTILYAPFDGTITNLSIEKFEIAAANRTVMTLDDLTEAEIKINIPAGNLPNITLKDKERIIGKEFEVTFPSRGNKSAKASIYEFKPVASANSETFEVSLKIKVPDDFLILPGMTVEVHNIPSKESTFESFISVPYASVVSKNGKTTVWVFNPKTSKASPREVTVSKTEANDKITVTGGLIQGEYIIAAGADWLTEENTIKVLNREVLNENR